MLKMGRNERKRAILGFLARQGRPATVAEIAWGVQVPYQPGGIRRLLLNYRRFGLIARRDLGRVARYEITARGRARLAWLREHSQ